MPTTQKMILNSQIIGNLNEDETISLYLYDHIRETIIDAVVTKQNFENGIHGVIQEMNQKLKLCEEEK